MAINHNSQMLTEPQFQSISNRSIDSEIDSGETSIEGESEVVTNSDVEMVTENESSPATSSDVDFEMSMDNESVTTAHTEPCLQSQSSSNHDYRSTNIEQTATGSESQAVGETQPINASNTTTNSTDPQDRNIFPFFSLPTEVRNHIYRYLISGARINVDATRSPTVHIYKPRPHTLRRLLPAPAPTITHPTTSTSTGLTLTSISLNAPMFGGFIPSTIITPLPVNRSFLTISKQFQDELRTELWSSGRISFERRWDFITAFANRSLQVDPDMSSQQMRSNLELGYASVSMAPLYTDVFQNISDLALNLTNESDFEGRVSFQEAKRVTMNIFTIIRQSMPALSSLTLFVDKRSKIHDQHVIFLPFGWFLEGLLSIKQLKSSCLKAGGNFRGTGPNRKVAQTFLAVLNGVVKEHLAGTAEERLGWRVGGGSGLMSVVGRRMLEKFEEGGVLVARGVLIQLGEVVRALDG